MDEKDMTDPPEYQPEEDAAYVAFLEREQARGPLAFAPYEIACEACRLLAVPSRSAEWQALQDAEMALVYAGERGIGDDVQMVDVPKWAESEVTAEPTLTYGQLRLMVAALESYLTAEKPGPAPLRKVVELLKPKRTVPDPSEAYRLECGHVAL